MSRMVHCIECGQEREHYAHGLCKACYGHAYRQCPGAKARHAQLERERRAEHPERYREYERRRSQTERRQKWQRKYSYAYYRRNREHLKAYARAYRQSDPKREARYARNHRAHRRRRAHIQNSDLWQEVLALHGERCYYCGRTDRPLEPEHKIPMSRGGTDALDNLVPSCHPCNMSKKDKTVEEYLAYLREVGEPIPNIS